MILTNRNHSFVMRITKFTPMQMFYNMIQCYPASIMTRESILISRVSESDNQFHTTNIFFEHIRRSKKSKKKLTNGEFLDCFCFKCCKYILQKNTAITWIREILTSKCYAFKIMIEMNLSHTKSIPLKCERTKIR